VLSQGIYSSTVCGTYTLFTLHSDVVGIFNVLEFPVTTVPMGLSSDGLPLSVHHSAHMLLQYTTVHTLLLQYTTVHMLL
jgi:hypothetical protein